MPAEPAIRFFEGPTGHRVAYAVHGDGPVLVCSAWWVSHLEEDWAQPAFRTLFQGLGQHFTVVRYDRPGAGLSDRERERIDPEDETATLAALIERVGARRLSLFGLTCAIPPALEFAAAHPERVDRLVLFGGYVKGGEVAPPPLQKAMTELVSAHWGMGAKMITDLFDPALDAEGREAMSRLQRLAASKQMAAALLGLTFATDVSDTAARVNTPALVLHRKGDRAIPFAAGRELAAALPNATFQPLAGDGHVPWAGDVDAALSAMLDFLAPKAKPPSTQEAGYTLARAGDVWTLTFGARTVHLKHSRGLSDLAVLLANPNRPVHVGTMWSGAATAAELGQTDDPVLDDEALHAYRARLRELEQQLVDAEGSRARSLREERDALSRELRAAVGLGGRKRDLDPTSERARKAVASRLRACLQKVAEASPAAGAHLKKCVTTGTYCCYQAPEGVCWQVR